MNALSSGDLPLVVEPRCGCRLAALGSTPHEAMRIEAVDGENLALRTVKAPPAVGRPRQIGACVSGVPRAEPRSFLTRLRRTGYSSSDRLSGKRLFQFFATDSH